MNVRHPGCLAFIFYQKYFYTKMDLKCDDLGSYQLYMITFCI